MLNQESRLKHETDFRGTQKISGKKLKAPNSSFMFQSDTKNQQKEPIKVE